MTPAEKRAVERVGEEVVAQDMRVLGSEVVLLLIAHEAAERERIAAWVEELRYHRLANEIRKGAG